MRSNVTRLQSEDGKPPKEFKCELLLFNDLILVLERHDIVNPAQPRRKIWKYTVMQCSAPDPLHATGLVAALLSAAHYLIDSLAPLSTSGMVHRMPSHFSNTFLTFQIVRCIFLERAPRAHNPTMLSYHCNLSQLMDAARCIIGSLSARWKLTTT